MVESAFNSATASDCDTLLGLLYQLESADKLIRTDA